MKNYSNQDHYAVLGIAKHASKEEVKKAHRRLLRENHPDKSANKEVAHEKTIQINLAYEVLSDDAKRANFDVFGSADAYAQQARAQQARNAAYEAEQKENERRTKINKAVRDNFTAAFDGYWHSNNHLGESAREEYNRVFKADGNDGVIKQTAFYTELYILWTELNDLGLNDLRNRYKTCCGYYGKYDGKDKPEVVATAYEQFLNELSYSGFIAQSDFRRLYEKDGEQGVKKAIPKFQTALEKHEALIEQFKEANYEPIERRHTAKTYTFQTKADATPSYRDVKPGGWAERILREREEAKRVGATRTGQRA